MQFFKELQQRNVFRVAIGYIVSSWLLVQVADLVLENIGSPDWVMQTIMLVMVLGFPVVVFFSWVYEVTPEGIKRESEIDRTQSTRHITGRKLDRAIVAVLVVALSYLAYDKFVPGPHRAPERAEGKQQLVTEPVLVAPDIKTEPDNSVAVLPFVNMSSDEEQEYFSDGLAEELLNLLAKIPELHVAARTSSFSFKGKNLEITEIASRLKVAHVLEGSVRKHGDQLRITAQLIQADNGYHLWSETYDRQLDNIFEIQEEIAIAVVDALKIKLLGEAPKIRKTDLAAYQLFLEGQYLKRQISEDSLLKAIEAFKQAVEIDPAYAPAWAELADSYIWIGASEKFSREEGHALADQAIATAISLDPEYAFAYYVRGISWIFSKKEFNRGIEDFNYALELEPDNAFFIAAIGKGAFVTGQFERAITQYKAALALEPVVPEFYWFIGKAYLSSGRLDEAEASFRKLLDLSPDAYGSLDLWETLFLKGDLEAALALLDAFDDLAAPLSITHYALGNSGKADEHLAKLIDYDSDSNPFSIARVYGYRGEKDKTFEWLNVMVENSSYFPIFILGDPALRSVHSDLRWPPFLEKLGLLEFWLEMPTNQE
ncbi:MAG: tetratricopeptide repeat protein [Xanthomonadales bacterium]|nr:tetratricopeptide repeat protein [Gammaproteobacteria bacterium]MBT8053203.1 tetratricopeptide repeat protein [Gammaproteobacteria bacterium]NNK50242.1 tetratricopeptide repeat protein [Xanthomonadales bacterium]